MSKNVWTALIQNEYLTFRKKCILKMVYTTDELLKIQMLDMTDVEDKVWF